jgi:regulator of RNase E activity RraB
VNWVKSMLGAEDFRFASEETKAILSRMTKDGDDLSQPREIDFNHLFEEKDKAEAFMNAALQQGYENVDCDFWDDQGKWQTAVHVFMVPELEEIDEIEAELDKIANSLGGSPDGWGCMEIVKPNGL